MKAALQLHAAIYAALAADNDLQALLGENRVFDDVPDGMRPPYVRFGRTVLTDWSTATETGIEHRLSLEAWSSHDGRKQALEIAGFVTTAALAVTLETPETILVNLEHQSTDIVRDRQTDWFVATVTLRAVTETPSS